VAVVVQQLGGQQQAQPGEQAPRRGKGGAVAPARHGALVDPQRGGQLGTLAAVGHHVGGHGQQGAGAAGGGARERAIQQPLRPAAAHLAQAPRHGGGRVFALQVQHVGHAPGVQRLEQIRVGHSDGERRHHGHRRRVADQVAQLF
jgi:hypothetical protein